MREAGDFFFFIDMEPLVSHLTFAGVAFAGGFL
jgi:hypothetical protein